METEVPFAGKCVMVLCVMACLFTDGQCFYAHIRQGLYKNPGSYESVVFTTSDTPPLSSLSMGSKVECALFCTQSSGCLQFFFNSSTQMCHISDMKIPGSQETFYTTYGDCFRRSDYKLYTEGALELCLKLVSTIVIQSTAKLACRNDGGHLVLIDNEAKRLLVKKILETFLRKSMWIDGEDAFGNNTMIDWKGDALTYFEWSDGKPTTDDCLIISSLYQFRFSDIPCSFTRGYVCQIDQ